jgi:hypothetical protein
VGGGEQHLFPGEPVPFPQLRRDGIGELRPHAHQVRGYQDQPLPSGVFHCQGLCVEVLQLAFGRLGSRAVTTHPKRLVGRDDHAGDAGLPRLSRSNCRSRICGGGCRRETNRTQDCEERPSYRKRGEESHCRCSCPCWRSGMSIRWTRLEGNARRRPPAPRPGDYTNSYPLLP